MFRGASAVNLDDKGRLAIPGRYRAELHERCDGHLVITVNHNKETCLWIYPLDEWEVIEKKVVALPEFNADHQKLKRLLIGYASDVEMDKSGRVVLAAPLRDYAKLNKAVYLLGQGNRFELWDEQLWTTRREQWLQEEMDTATISPEMEQLSL